MGGREWERDPQSKRRGLTGAKGGWWVCGVQPLGVLFCVLLLAATRRGSSDEKLCVRTQISDMHALLCLKPVKCPHQYAGAAGSVIIDPVLGSCFS